MPTYRLYEHVIMIHRREVEADTPQAAKTMLEENITPVRDVGIDPNWYEAGGDGIFSIDEVVTDDIGHREYNEVWCETLGYACPSCGAFEQTDDCHCQKEP